MLSRIFGAMIALLLTTACTAQAPDAAQAQFQAGTDYFPIEPAAPLSPGNDRIEVVEVFGYSCIHCANAEPVISAWKKNLPEDVAFIYLPAVFGGVWEAFARAFYTAETMGVLSRTHDAMFKAVHVDRRGFRSLEDIAAFYAEQGVDKEQFLATMESFAVNAKIARAQQMAPRWGVEGTPSIVVAGKYRVVAPREGSFEKMLQIVDFLVAKERAERKAA